MRERSSGRGGLRCHPHLGRGCRWTGPGARCQSYVWGDGRETGQQPQAELLMGPFHLTLKFPRDTGAGLPQIHREK